MNSSYDNNHAYDTESVSAINRMKDMRSNNDMRSNIDIKRVKSMKKVNEMKYENNSKILNNSKGSNAIKNVLEYKGYHSRIEFDVESMTLRGKIEGINDYVDFEADDINSIKEEFHLAVDDYLDFCKEVGKNPEKEYKGTFNIRISPALHKELALYALMDDCSLNTEVEKAIIKYVDSKKRGKTKGSALLCD